MTLRTSTSGFGHLLDVLYFESTEASLYYIMLHLLLSSLWGYFVGGFSGIKVKASSSQAAELR